MDAVIRKMKEETGLTVKAPILYGIKQFPMGNGRYLVFLFGVARYEGTLTSSPDGKMVWVDRACLQNYKTVDDLPELLQVMQSDNLSEFQYVVKNGQWKVVLR